MNVCGAEHNTFPKTDQRAVPSDPTGRPEQGDRNRQDAQELRALAA